MTKRRDSNMPGLSRLLLVALLAGAMPVAMAVADDSASKARPLPPEATAIPRPSDAPPTMPPMPGFGDAPPIGPDTAPASMEPPTSAPAEPLKWQPVAADADLLAEMQTRLELTKEQHDELTRIQADRQKLLETWDQRNAARLELQRKRITDAKDETARTAQEKVLERILRTRENFSRLAYRQAMGVLTQPQRDIWNGERLAGVVLAEFNEERLSDEQMGNVLEMAAKDTAGYTGEADVGETKANVLRLTRQTSEKVLTEEQREAWKRRTTDTRRRDIRNPADLRERVDPADVRSRTGSRRSDPRDAAREGRQSSGDPRARDRE